MSCNIVILSNARSLNKTRLHIKSLMQLGFNPVVLTDIDKDSLNTSEHYCSEIQYYLLDLNQREKVLSLCADLNPTAICTTSENLLELLVFIEEKCGLPLSISKEGAQILSNKYLFDQFCQLKNLPVATSILPHTEDDFINFNKPCILKASVGSGQFYNFRDEVTGDFFEYRFFKSGFDLKEYLKDINKLDFVLDANNRQNFRPTRYSRTPVEFYLQEYHEPEAEYCCLGSFANGQLTINGTGRLFKSAEVGDRNATLLDLDKKGRDQHNTEHQLYIMGPPRESNRFVAFLKSIGQDLKIRNLMFSGPDYFKLSNSNYIYSDFNGRISGQFNEIPDEIATDIVKEYWKRVLLDPSATKTIEIDMCYGTGFPYLKSGHYAYQEQNPNIKFTKLNFHIQKNRKSMDNKINQTKLVLKAATQEGIITLFDDLSKILVVK